MIAIDTDELLLDMNETALKFMGYSKDEVKGKNWFDKFVPEAKRTEARLLFHDMLSANLRHVYSKHSVLTKEGEERTLNFHNILVSNEKAQIIGVISASENVTKLTRIGKALRKVENKLQISLDYMIEGCQIIDRNWRYIYVNKALVEQARRSKDELLGHTMMEMYPDIEQTELFRHLQDSMTKRLPHQMENEFTFPDGSKGWFEIRIEPVPVGVLVLSTDITQRKQLDEELNKYRHRLEHVVAQRTAEYASANEELKRKIQELQKVEQALKLRAAILDKSKEAIFLVNTKGDFIYANAAASKSYGYTLDQFLNMNLRSLLRPRDAPSSEMFLKHIIEKGEVTIEMVHLCKSAAEMPVRVHSNIVETTHGQLIVFLVRRLDSR